MTAKAPLTRRAVAALFLERQWLDRPRARRLSAASLGGFVTATGGLQIDSVHVVDRAHHLTLWSRFGAYDRAKLERLLYRDRVLIEYFTHVACFAARADLPLLKAFMLQTPTRWDRTTDWHRKNRAAIERVERAVSERGPLGTADFEKPPGSARSDGWWDWKPATRALDYLWKCGRLGIHSRVHFRKRYDLAERVLPELGAMKPLAPETANEERLLRSLQAMGAATLDDLRMYWSWPQMMAPVMKATIARLAASGRITACEVEDERGPWWARTEDLPALARAEKKRSPSLGTVMLAPFDSFLWHRLRIERLWGFHYRIEIYVPEGQRQHGYYSMPVLHDGVFIGRVDLKTHRKEGVLEARHAHFEPWFAKGQPPPRAAWNSVDRPVALAGLAEALSDLARHVGASRVKLDRVTPASLRAPLAQALRASLSGSPAAPHRAARRIIRV